jgi:spermidine synthase
MACDALVFRWPIAYCSADFTPLTNTIVILAFVGLATGTGVGLLSMRRSSDELAAGYAALSLFVQICPWLYWLSFDGLIQYKSLLILLPLVSGAALSILFVWTVGYAVRASTPGKLLQDLLSPNWLLAAAVMLLVFAALSVWVGSLLYGAVVGSAFLGLAVCTPHDPLSNSSLSYRRVFLLLYATATTVSAANAWFANRQLPAAAVHSTTHTIVHFARGRHLELRITSAQEAFHVFVGGRLRFSSLDQDRWAKALTQPAIERSQCPRRALVFSQGEGLAERELLKGPCIQSVVSVVSDRVAVDAARRQPWWRHAIADAWHSPRVQVIERDPAVWLLETPPTLFDLVISDLPDPDNYSNAKYYSRFFFREIRKRMEPAAFLAIQATSALRSPRTFASIAATVKDSGYFMLPYRVAMTTLGEWSFILASPTNISAGPRSRTAINVDAATAVSFSFPPDAVWGKTGQVSRLDDPVALEAFLDENGEDAP